MKKLTTNLITLLMLLAVGCMRAEPDRIMLSDRASEIEKELSEIRNMEECDVTNAISNARNSNHAVIFVHMDWSPQSVIGRKYFSQFMADYEHSMPDKKLLFHYINGTSIPHDYASFREIPGWVEQNNGPHFQSGAGEIIWLRNGKVINIDTAYALKTSAKFFKITDSLMPDVSKK